jgi:hypothetical protein
MLDAASTMFPDQSAAALAPQSRPAPRQPVNLAYSASEIYQRQQQARTTARDGLLGVNDEVQYVQPAEVVADRLFGEQPTPQAQPQSFQAATLNPLQVPPEVAQLRKANATIEDRMFAGTPVDLGENATSVLRHDNPLASDAELAAFSAEVGNVMTKDFMGSTTDAKQVLNYAMENRTSPPGERQIGEWRRQAAQQLVARYGKSANQVLADAKRMIQRDPRVVNALNAFNLGDRPEVVMLVAESALRARASGHLK